ncbi:hypothetical protein EV44_g5494 [Erysiphe necator]|uniref:CCHC-type domain-containing protein n=1 Tax=Uncinula necator TaxID=52586 RepID=A0A0B1PEI5_UNCNE|nr:hypothetical protein EV44_g5494 [Erysiphe necator]
MLRVINILCTGDAANWIDSTPRVREQITNRKNATEASVAYVKCALEERFPGCVSDQTELSIQSEVENLRQGSEEPVATYYARTVRLLNRTRGQDKPKAESVGLPLTGPEEFTLSAIIMAYTRGLFDEILRKEVFAKSGASCSSLWKCQEVIIETQRTMELMKQYEEQAAENHELQRLRDLVLSDCGQLSSVVLAAKAELSFQVMKQAPMRPPHLDLAQEHSNIQPQPPYHPSYHSRGQGNTRGRGGVQITQNWRDNIGLKKEGNPHPPRSSSKNPYVNMSIAYDKNIHLCVGCGKTGHVKPNCKNPPLQLWEQAYLKQMVFGGPGISAHLLVLESEGAYYEEAENSQNQEHGYAFEKASAASSVLSNPA